MFINFGMHQQKDEVDEEWESAMNHWALLVDSWYYFCVRVLSL